MTYKYRVYSKEKKIVEGKLDVASESMAETALYHAGFQNIISLKKVTPGVDLGKFTLKLVNNVKTKEVVDASNQMATLIHAGITLSSALKLIEGQILNKTLKNIFHRLGEEIQTGNSLSKALSLFPQVFPNTYSQIIKASEQAGTLETGFRQGAKILEKQDSANQKIKRAMVYPTFVLLLAVGVGILLITVALPPLTNLFTSLSAELPWMTSLLIGVSNFLLSYGLYVLAGILIFVLSIFILLRNPVVKLARDKFLLKMPIIGKIIIERSMGLFCQTVSLLLEAGLQLPQVLEIVIQANRNQAIRNALTDVRERLIQGQGLAQPMADNKLFPPLVVEIITVGEKTGMMDITLGDLAVFYEHEVDRKVDSLISMIEPAFTIAIGAVVLFLALSMITPMYSILGSVH
jgi:type IV pilus assembly protein PilC